MNATEARRECRARNIEWPAAQQLYRELRQLARQDCEVDWEPRREAWRQYGWGPGSVEFWRHGLHAKYRRAFQDGDGTNIPNFDCFADELGWDSDRLFDHLRSDYLRVPTPEKIWREVFGLLETEPAEMECDLCNV